MNRLIFVFLICTVACQTQRIQGQQPNNATLQVGAARFEQYLPRLQGKNVALVVNQTAQVNNQHLADELLSRNIKIVKVFAPEHGFRGNADAGEKINNEVDAKTGLPIISLYGTNYKPKPEQLQDVDVVIFDIQDVGARFYTYISTMHYVMEACAENKKTLFILDRPNPNGHYVDGNVLDTQQVKSFVGMHPVPVVHGLTIGEYAQMINGEKWLKGGAKCDLSVITCLNYTHKTPYSLPVRPSPNLPNDRAISLYPSLCLFEGTVISVGRGTDTPFQLAGHPDYPTKTFSFTPQSVAGAKNPPFLNKVCYGQDYRTETNWKYRFSLAPVIHFYQSAPDKAKFFNQFFEKLGGGKALRQQIEAGKTEEEIRKSWQPALDNYKKMRKKYLLYDDFE